VLPWLDVDYKGGGKVKFTQWMSWKHIEAVEVYLSSCFNLSAKWRWVFNTTLRPLYAGNGPVPIVYEAQWVQDRFGWVRKISPPPGFDRRTSASRYTGYIIPAQCWLQRTFLSRRLACQSVLNCIGNRMPSGLEVGWGRCATRPYDWMIRALRPGVDPKVAQSNHGLILRLFLWLPATVQFTQMCRWWWHRSPNQHCLL
jgi:hypothetical protein